MGKIFLPLYYYLLVFLTDRVESFKVSASEWKSEHDSSKMMQSDSDEFFHCDGNFPRCGIVKKVEYFLCAVNRNACAIEMNFNSACVRCEICLSIADQINRTLLFIHNRLGSISCPLNDAQIESLLETICEYSFANYRLREIDDVRIISEPLPKSQLIATSMDEHWDDHLKTRCHHLTKQMGRTKLYNFWKSWWQESKLKYESSELRTILCRNKEVNFRDCRGIEDSKQGKISLDVGDEQLKRKIRSTFPQI